MLYRPKDFSKLLRINLLGLQSLTELYLRKVNARYSEDIAILFLMSLVYDVFENLLLLIAVSDLL